MSRGPCQPLGLSRRLRLTAKMHGIGEMSNRTTSSCSISDCPGSTTNFGAELVFQVDIARNVVVRMAAEDLAELLGALIEKAARFARRRVSVSGQRFEEARAARCSPLD